MFIKLFIGLRVRFYLCNVIKGNYWLLNIDFKDFFVILFLLMFYNKFFILNV